MKHNDVSSTRTYSVRGASAGEAVCARREEDSHGAVCLLGGQAALFARDVLGCSLELGEVDLLAHEGELIADDLLHLIEGDAGWGSISGRLASEGVAQEGEARTRMYRDD